MPDPAVAIREATPGEVTIDPTLSVVTMWLEPPRV
jgi:hypothetical protein